MARICLEGDVGKAGAWLGYAKSRLFALKRFLVPIGMHSSREEIADASIFVSSFKGQDTIRIIGKYGAIDFLIVLLTIAIQQTEGSYVDGAGKSIYKPYFYRITEKDGEISIARAPEQLITYGTQGLNLTLQTDSKTILANVANSFTPYEEEIGAVDWRRLISDLPDRNLRWGDTTAELVEGSNFAKDAPDSLLKELSHARHSFHVDNNDKVDGKNFNIDRTSIGTPTSIMGSIITNFYNRLEQANTLREMFIHYLSYIPIDDEGNEGSRITTQTYQDTFYDIINWLYHVPIMMMSPEEVLRRQVESTGTYANFPCTTQIQEEVLAIGETVLDTATYTTTASYTIGAISATKQIMGTYDASDLSVSGTCPDEMVGWTMVVTPAEDAPLYVLDRHGKEATLYTSPYAGYNGGCSTCTVTATCGGCGSTSKDFIVGGSWKWTDGGSSYPLPTISAWSLGNCEIGTSTAGCGENSARYVDSMSELSLERIYYGLWHATCGGGYWNCGGVSWSGYGGFSCSKCYEEGVPDPCSGYYALYRGTCRIDLYEWKC